LPADAALRGRLRGAARTFFPRVRTPADAGRSVGFRPIARTGRLAYAVAKAPRGPHREPHRSHAIRPTEIRPLPRPVPSPKNP
jgi:hypothetical protein